MPISKIIFGEEVLMDLTEDTVSADMLMQGVTAHDKAGNLITGTGDFVEQNYIMEVEY